MIWDIFGSKGGRCHERIVLLGRLYCACARVVLRTSWLSSRSLMIVRVEVKLNFILFIGAILFSVCIKTGHFTKNHSFLILHSEQNITCNSWITSHPYSHHNFYHTLLLMHFVMLVISRSAAASFSMYVFWKHLK